MQSRVTSDPMDWDPTHGYVRYRTREAALEGGLIKYQGDGVYLGVDHENVWTLADGRPSIRLESKKAYTKGLFIARFNHLPKIACGAWPALYVHSRKRMMM